MLASIDKSAHALGLLADGETTGMNHGSKINGIAYRLYMLKPGSTGEWNHPAFSAGQCFLGMTAGEADKTLSVIQDVLWNVQYAQEKKSA